MLIAPYLAIAIFGDIYNLPTYRIERVKIPKSNRILFSRIIYFEFLSNLVRIAANVEAPEFGMQTITADLHNMMLLFDAFNFMTCRMAILLMRNGDKDAPHSGLFT